LTSIRIEVPLERIEFGNTRYRFRNIGDELVAQSASSIKVNGIVNPVKLLQHGG